MLTNKIKIMQILTERGLLLGHWESSANTVFSFSFLFCFRQVQGPDLPWLP